MTEREKMLSGELYDPTDKELEQLRVNARKLARKYNSTDEDDQEKQAHILRELLPATEELPYLQAPVYFDYGCNTFFGRFSSANFNFTCLDVGEIHIGDNVMIGPNVTLATPMHPLLPEERNIRKREDGSFYNLEYAKPITIKDNCWLASNVVVCGGVTIGEGCVIGAATPFPCKLRLNRPSLPNTADERFFLATTLLFTFASQARNMPSSIVIPAGPHLPMSARIIYLYVGSNTRQPSPTYSGLTAVSFVTAPLSAFPRKSPIPFTPDVACTLPPIYCMAPA